MLEAALAGYACALFVRWAAARAEKWWAPKWAVTVAAFDAARATPAVAAASAAIVSAATTSRVVTAAASGAVAWLIAQAYVLLIVAARR